MKIELPMRLSDALLSMTPSRLACLHYYSKADGVHPRDRIIPADASWNSRQMNWVLEAGLITVGPDGWRVLSDLGRRVVAARPIETEGSQMADYDEIRGAFLAGVASAGGVTTDAAQAVLLKFLDPDNGWFVVNVVGFAFGEAAKEDQAAWDRAQEVMRALRYVVTNDDRDYPLGPIETNAVALQRDMPMIDQDLRYRLADLMRDQRMRKPEAIETASEVLEFFAAAGLVIVRRDDLTCLADALRADDFTVLAERIDVLVGYPMQATSEK